MTLTSTWTDSPGVAFSKSLSWRPPRRRFGRCTGGRAQVVAHPRDRLRRDLDLVDPQQPDAGAACAVLQFTPGMGNQIDDLGGDPPSAARGVAWDQAHRASLSRSVPPRPDGLAVESEPGGRRLEAVHVDVL